MQIKPDKIQIKHNVQKVILADDLTGAMDAGVQLVKCGKSVKVRIIGMREYNFKEAENILVLDTESRNGLPEAAYSTLLESIISMKSSGIEIIYKKIDSTLRGNVGKELEAIIHSGICNMIALVPALPQNGRTTIRGFHYINGELLGRTDLAKDPFAPVKSSFIPELVSFQTNLPTRLITIEEVRQGKEHICSRFECLYNEGAKIIVSDAETVEDLEIIAEALHVCKVKILPCGSAGLLSLLCVYKEEQNELNYEEKNLHGREQKNEQRKQQKSQQNMETGPLLVICGSPAMASKNQVRFANETSMELLKLSSYRDNIDKLKEKALHILKSGKDLIIDGSGEGKNEITLLYNGDVKSLNSDSEKIQEALGEITADVVCSVSISGLMIIGGDTTAAICRKIGADSIKIEGEVEPFVPWGSLSGGSAEGLMIVTKAGGFGSENVILNTSEYLKGV